jgi:hypothetical protein
MRTRSATSVSAAPSSVSRSDLFGDQTLTRQVEGATGQGNQNDLTLHFGVGNHKDPVRLEIRWTDGTRQQLESAVDRTITVKREKGK